MNPEQKRIMYEQLASWGVNSHYKVSEIHTNKKEVESFINRILAANTPEPEEDERDCPECGDRHVTYFTPPPPSVDVKREADVMKILSNEMIWERAEVARSETSSEQPHHYYSGYVAGCQWTRSFLEKYIAGASRRVLTDQHLAEIVDRILEGECLVSQERIDALGCGNRDEAHVALAVRDACGASRPVLTDEELDDIFQGVKKQYTLKGIWTHESAFELARAVRDACGGALRLPDEDDINICIAEGIRRHILAGEPITPTVSHCIADALLARVREMNGGGK